MNIRINNNPIDKIAKTLAQYVCPLYKPPEYGRGVQAVGSGVFMQMESRSFLLTAAHVLQHFPDNIFVIPGTELITFKGKTSAIHYEPQYSIDADVAAIELPHEVAHAVCPYAFLTPDKCGDVLPYDKLTLYVFVGCPRSRNKRTSPSLKILRARSHYLVCREFCEIDQFKTRGKCSSTHFGFSLPFDKARTAAGDPLVPPDPHGMSGGGIWRITFDKSDGSISHPLLVGIGIEYHKQKAALIGTHIRYALGMAKELMR